MTTPKNKKKLIAPSVLARQQIRALIDTWQGDSTTAGGFMAGDEAANSLLMVEHARRPEALDKILDAYDRMLITEEARIISERQSKVTLLREASTLSPEVLALLKAAINDAETYYCPKTRTLTIGDPQNPASKKCRTEKEVIAFLKPFITRIGNRDDQEEFGDWWASHKKNADRIAKLLVRSDPDYFWWLDNMLSGLQTQS